MSDIEARVKKIIAEQLGVAEADITAEKASSLPIWALTPWTPSNS